MKTCSYRACQTCQATGTRLYSNASIHHRWKHKSPRCAHPRRRAPHIVPGQSLELDCILIIRADADGDTPLYCVENIETARWLIDRGAIVDHRNHENVSVRLYSTNESVAQMLIDLLSLLSGSLRITQRLAITFVRDQQKRLLLSMHHPRRVHWRQR